MSTIDPTRCPICHEPNICAMEKAKASGTKPEHYWCMDAVFTPAVMDLVPDQAKGKACVCANVQVLLPDPIGLKSCARFNDNHFAETASQVGCD